MEVSMYIPEFVCGILATIGVEILCGVGRLSYE